MELPEAVRKEIAHLADLLGKVAQLVLPAEAAEKGVLEIGIENDHTLVEVCNGGGMPYVSVHVVADNFKQVGAFGKALRGRGFRLLRQQNSGTTKVVRYTGPITAYFTFGNGDCQYVQVGTRPAPIFELQCGKSKSPDMPAGDEA